MATVLVIAGLNGSPAFFRHANDRLFPGIRVVEFDHLLDRAEGGVAGLAERAWARVAHLPADEPLYLAGESFGGPVALELARAHLERLAGLILFSTFGRFPPEHAWYRRPGLWLWRVVGDRGAEAILYGVRPFELPAQLGARLSPSLAREFLRLPPSLGGAYCEKCRLALDFNALPWLGELDLPALVVVPRWDHAVPPSAGLALAAALPRATLVRIPGGHLAHLAYPELVGRMIEEWLVATGHAASVGGSASRMPRI